MSQQIEIEYKLREKILNLELLPGQKISERWAEQEFQVSRTPVRAALLRLEAEGLVQKEERCWRITQINIEELKQLFEFREILEVSALRVGAKNITESFIEKLYLSEKNRFSSTVTAERSQIGTDFHLLIASLSNNLYLIECLTDIMQRLSRTRKLDSSSGSSGWSEHLQILESLKVNNIDIACEQLTNHIRSSRDRILNNFDTNFKKFKIYNNSASFTKSSPNKLIE